MGGGVNNMTKREKAEEIIKTEGKCSCKVCPFDSECELKTFSNCKSVAVNFLFYGSSENWYGRSMLESVIGDLKKSNIVQPSKPWPKPEEKPWQTLTLENLPKDIDFRKAPVSQYEIEWSTSKGKWEKLLLSFTEWEDIIKNIRSGTEYRYREFPKKETVEEAAERIWKETKRKKKDHPLFNLYENAFKAGAQWQKEQK